MNKKIPIEDTKPLNAKKWFIVNHIKNKMNLSLQRKIKNPLIVPLPEELYPFPTFD
jgi:hypothetical protein